MTVRLYEPFEARARVIWHSLTPTERHTLKDAWQLGFRRFPEGSNPYQIDQDTWQWAAFEMGWQESDRLNR